jgi:hypothetical protein
MLQVNETKRGSKEFVICYLINDFHSTGIEFFNLSPVFIDAERGFTVKAIYFPVMGI